MTVKDKVAIVTGGASGIGRASALLLAANGAKVVVADRNGEGAYDVCAEISSRSGSALAIAVDVGDAAAARRLVDQTTTVYGRIDVLLHAAGICPRKPFLEMDDED